MKLYKYNVNSVLLATDYSSRDVKHTFSVDNQAELEGKLLIIYPSLRNWDGTLERQDGKPKTNLDIQIFFYT